MLFLECGQPPGDRIVLVERKICLASHLMIICLGFLHEMEER